MSAVKKPAARAAQAAQIDTAAETDTVTLKSGNLMPVLGLGSWMLTSDTATRVAHALSLGYRLVDTCGDYKTQGGIGKAIRAMGMRRDALFIVTKVEEDDDGYDATRKNLDELKLEYADLVLIHRPPEPGVGEKVWEGLRRARDEGLARDIGVSSYKVGQIEELARITGEMPAVNQIEWTPFGHSLDMLNFCRANQIVVQAWSPLTRGKRLADEKLSPLAEKYGKSPAQIILRWDLQHGVVPLPKAQRPDHQRENLDIFDFELDARDMATLDNLNQHFSALEKLDYV